MESYNIYIVEDEKIVAIDLKRRLINLGYKIVGISAKAETAIDSIRVLNPDLVIMDIMLKGSMDGIVAAGIIKKEFDIPIIFLTASTDDATLQRAKYTEPYGYILKPFDIKDIKSVIEIALYKKKAERLIQDQEMLLNATLNSLKDGVIAVDHNNKIIYINKKAQYVLNVYHEDVLGKNLSDVYTTNDEMSEDAILCGINEIFDKELFNLREYKTLNLANGKKLPIAENITPIKNRKKQISGQVINFKDITKRLKMQKEIIASHNFYLTLFEDSPALVWKANNEGIFNYFNQTWLNFRSSSIENEIYEQIYNYIHPEDLDSFKEYFKTHLISKKQFQCEFRLLSGSGNYIWMICFGVPFYNIKKKYEGFLGYCFDITARKNMELDLQKAKCDAESSSRAKSAFLSAITHEIRTPLNHILGLSDLLYDSKLSGDQLEWLKIIKKSGFHLLAQFNNIIKFSNEESITNFNIEDVSLKQIIEQIIFEYNLEINKKHLIVNYNVEKLPPKFKANKEALFKIIYHVLGNAIKFTEQGRVFLTALLEENDLHIIIEDTGIGIPENKKEIIFDSFTQVDGSLCRKYNGIGLGLSITKQIVTALRGKIYFESYLNQGSKFHILLPYN